MNNKQQLVALYPDVANIPAAEIFSLLRYWKEIGFFERLPALSLMLRVEAPATIPVDLDTRLPASRIVLCIPESVCADKEVQTRLQHFVLRGFQVVVDDFASQIGLAWEDTRIIGVDCAAGLPFFIKPWLTRLSGVPHWAKNIADATQLDEAGAAGFKLFSGDYAFNPPAANKTSDGSARTRLLKLLGLVSRDAESRELEELFKQDTTLSFMLFKLVSSAAFAQTVRVSSFGQAINLLGRRQLQRWLQLLLYARQQENGGGLNPLMPRAAFRASMMEMICRKQGANKDQLDGAFMVGMFSLLDKLFGSELEEVLQPLNLSEDVLAALLNKSGQLGRQLQLTEYADRPQAASLNTLLQGAGLDADGYYDCMINAYVWVNQVCQDM
ncbi:MAG: HDOD domain-containing protein [Burkholderiales bacterium]|nr:HDOD domain-containing protein [Burkholderiales bacterium]